MLSCLCSVACAPQNGPQPKSAPAGENPAFATKYPTRLTAATGRYDVELESSAKLREGLAKYPDEIQGPDWEYVQHVYELADADGKSAHFAAVQEENALVAKFFVDEKQAIVRQVGGSVTAETKKNSCEGEYYGAVSWSLEKSVQDRLDERVEAASSARRYLEQRGTSLKKADRDKLAKHAQSIALASYLAHVALPERHAELQRLVAEQSDVAKTLRKKQSELQAIPEDAGTADEQKARKAELGAVQKAMAELEAPHKAAKERLEKSEEAVNKAQGDYEAAFAALIDKVDERAHGPKAAVIELDEQE